MRGFVAGVSLLAGTAVALAPAAQAARAPSDGGPSCWFQTNGREVAPGKGDWYTSIPTASTQRSHVFQIVVPPGAAFPVAVRVRDAEARIAGEEQHDEVVNGSDPTRFTLRRPGGGILAQQTFPPGSPLGSVFQASISASDGPGTYRVISETGAFPISGDGSGKLNDDQNSFRVEVLPDGGTTPEGDDDVRITFTRATIACTPVPDTPPTRLTLAYVVPDGTAVTSLRNFDLDVAPGGTAGSLSYVPPAGSPVPGTMSVDSAWNGGGTLNAGEDVVPVGDDQHGLWTVRVPATYWENQVAFEAWAGAVQLPVSVVPLNRPAEWQDPTPVTVSEPIGTESVPVVRSVALEIDEQDAGQTLSFSLPAAGACKTATGPHPFTGASFATGSVVSASETVETATLRLPVGAQDAGTYCVRVRVTDGASARDLELTVTVAEANSTPRADAGPDQSAHEPGAMVTLDGTGSTDPDGDPLTLSWTGFDPADPVVEFLAPPVGTHTYELSADDGELVGTDVVVLTVRDGAPVVSPPKPPVLPARRLVAVPLGSFSDPGSTSPWSVDVDWGDGTPHTVRDAAAQGSLGTAAHTFLNGGLYSVTVTVTDAEDKPGSATFSVRVRPPCRVPDVRGKSLAGARRALKRRSCSLGSVTRAFSGRVRRGRIISQRPRAGALRPTGAQVRVRVSKGPRG
ncbi:MAG TPA: PKD domain-containing protein [Gaiellaceae bacterium]|nr:PKD domain-containing protein [Gaiellaceae bacterium]